MAEPESSNENLQLEIYNPKAVAKREESLFQVLRSSFEKESLSFCMFKPYDDNLPTYPCWINEHRFTVPQFFQKSLYDVNIDFT